MKTTLRYLKHAVELAGQSSLLYTALQAVQWQQWQVGGHVQAKAWDNWPTIWTRRGLWWVGWRMSLCHQVEVKSPRWHQRQRRSGSKIVSLLARHGGLLPARARMLPRVGRIVSPRRAAIRPAPTSVLPPCVDHSAHTRLNSTTSTWPRLEKAHGHTATLGMRQPLDGCTMTMPCRLAMASTSVSRSSLSAASSFHPSAPCGMTWIGKCL